MQVFGLLITKDDHEAFGHWCRDQLPFYEAVVCLDGSVSDQTARQARDFPDRLIYLHERDFHISAKGDHGLRRVVHTEIVRRFGTGIWVMCCHVDEFCYHDPRKIAALAERESRDLVSWFSPHFFPHPSELADLGERLRRPVQDRFEHYHWGHMGSGLPWIEDRLYYAGPGVEWDATTHGSVRPHGLRNPAPFHPIYRHFKVCSIDLAGYQLDGSSTLYRGHWENQQNRTGLAFRVERLEDLFVSSVPTYSFCNRFNGKFDQPWNMGEEFRPDLPETTPFVGRPSSASSRTHSIVPVSPATGSRPIVAIGPRIADFGLRDWVGTEISDELSTEFDVRVFDHEVPHSDLIIFLQFKPEANMLRRISRSSAVIYCPFDNYGSSREIDADAAALGACDRVLVHCERLRKYLTAYTSVEYIDHHVKVAATLRATFQPDGPILWVGGRTNLPPLVDWVNQHHLTEELWVLTNPENLAETPHSQDFGFQPHNRVRVERWSAERQREWTAVCRGALDIIGDDFRARHKSPAKAIDYLASGVPLALQPDSSTAEHLARLGFDVASVDDWDRWRSRGYWEETTHFGAALRELLSREQIGQTWRRILNEVLVARGHVPKLECPGSSDFQKEGPAKATVL